MRSGADAFLGLLGRVVRAGAAVTRSGSGALALAYVAAGRRDGFVENHINAWDCLAGIALTREAGGYVSDFLAGDGLRARRADRRLRAGPQGRAHRGRRDPGARAVTEAAIALAAGEARLAIARRGAEATAWSVGGVELLVAGRSGDLG